MNKRVLKLSAAAIVGVFALSACGNNGSGEPTNGATSAGGDTPAAVDPANLETTISILAPSYSDSSQADWQKIIDKFNETYPKVEVDLQIEGWDGFTEKISARIQAGDYPDILNDNAFAGSADALAFENALNRAYDAARNRLLDRVHDRILATLQALPGAGTAAANEPPAARHAA